MSMVNSGGPVRTYIMIVRLGKSLTLLRAKQSCFRWTMKDDRYATAIETWSSLRCSQCGVSQPKVHSIEPKLCRRLTNIWVKKVASQMRLLLPNREVPLSNTKMNGKSRKKMKKMSIKML